MRENLFHGKRKDNGDWVEGCLLGSDVIVPKGQQFYICHDILDSALKAYEVIPETVGQYTGLTDKNGRKIFEGDIVEGNSEYFTYTHPYGKVVYDGGQYLISFDDVLEDIECLGAWANDVEIIGNIYDNPELLEVSGNEM